MVNALVDAGREALLLKTTEGRCSSLYVACFKGRISIVKALIEASGEERLLKATKR
jgi:hypothetical protein